MYKIEQIVQPMKSGTIEKTDSLLKNRLLPVLIKLLLLSASSFSRTICAFPPKESGQPGKRAK